MANFFRWYMSMLINNLWIKILFISTCDFCFLMCKIPQNNLTGGGGVLPIMAFMGKGVPFQKLRYIKGREIGCFTMRSEWITHDICLTFLLVMLDIFPSLQGLRKEMHCFKVGMWKGYLFWIRQGGAFPY